MSTISLCMIVKNEEDTLENCLLGIADLVDEIIIVDTGSHDNTKTIAKKFTDKIFDFEWIDDFSAARNYSFAQATMDYVMWLDADDIVTDENRDIFVNLKKNLDGKVKQIAAKYNVSFNELGQVALSYYRERILLRSQNYKWIGAIHEVIAFDNNIVYSEFTVTHKKIHPTQSGRNLRIFEKMKRDNVVFDARQTFYYARELLYNEQYLEATQLFYTVIHDDGCWVENRLSACLDLYKCQKALKNNQSAIEALLYSFSLATPKAEICCTLASEFFSQNKLKESEFWYLLALNDTPNIKNGSFVKMECYGYIPAISLCVIYDKLREYSKAEFYNNLAETFKPGDKSVEFNKEYFKNLKGK